MKRFTTRMAFHIVVVFAVAALLLCSASAQQSERPEPLAPHARLMAARSIYIEHAGLLLPNDVISDAFHGWGRYIIAAEPAQADLIVSINAPADSTQIVLSVLDAHDRVVLWSGSERPKSSMKQRQRDDNAIESSLRLFRRFRNVIEPEPEPEFSPAFALPSTTFPRFAQHTHSALVVLCFASLTSPAIFH